MITLYLKRKSMISFFAMRISVYVFIIVYIHCDERLKLQLAYEHDGTHTVGLDIQKIP